MHKIFKLTTECLLLTFRGFSKKKHLLLAKTKYLFCESKILYGVYLTAYFKEISREIWIKCYMKVLKNLLPSCCQEKFRPEKMSFKIDEVKYIVSISFLLYNSQFPFRKFINFETNMMGEFLLSEKNTAIKSYSVKGLKISKELKRLSENVYKFVKKITYVKHYFK